MQGEPPVGAEESIHTVHALCSLQGEPPVSAEEGIHTVHVLWSLQGEPLVSAEESIHTVSASQFEHCVFDYALGYSVELMPGRPPNVTLTPILFRSGCHLCLLPAL